MRVYGILPLSDVQGEIDHEINRSEEVRVGDIDPWLIFTDLPQSRTQAPKPHQSLPYANTVCLTLTPLSCIRITFIQR